MDAATAVRRTHDWFEVNSGWAPPDDDELAEWLAEGVCRCPDDCLVRPEGWCAHGLASWWLVLRALDQPSGLVVRPRVDGDGDAITRIAAIVAETDGYPGRVPSDLRAFVISPDVLGAWVAEYDGEIAGHVALYRSSMPIVMELAAAALDRDPSELAAVGRLIVDPAFRRRGVGRALLGVAADWAAQHGLHPALEVVPHFVAAAALYRSCGWRDVGEVTLVFDDGSGLEVLVYVGPEA